MIFALPAVGGLILGSFLNVVTYRLPRRRSLVSPGSCCPHCATPVAPYDNIPVLSWMFLRGRCRRCGGAISARYPLVEAGTAALFAAVVAVHGGIDRHVWPDLALVAVLVPAALIDLDTRRIPNPLMAIGALLGLVLIAAVEPNALPKHLIAAAAAGGTLLIAALARPGGMGMGDVKLAAVIGLFLGAAVVPALLLALLAGSLVGVVVLMRRGVHDGRRTRIPFGPFLALGAIVGMLAGNPIVHWYATAILHHG